MKERMTIEELEQLLKENPDGVEMICDDGWAFGAYSNIVAMFLCNNNMGIKDLKRNADILNISALCHYPSQKKKDEIVELKRGSDGFYRTLDGIGILKSNCMIEFVGSSGVPFHPNEPIVKFNLTTKKWVL